MPQIILSAQAIRDLQRFRSYLLQFNEDAAKKAAVTILETTNLLLIAPNMGKPLEDKPEYRQIIAKFGAGTFTICYRLDFDSIIIVAIKHSREKSLYIQKAFAVAGRQGQGNSGDTIPILCSTSSPSFLPLLAPHQTFALAGGQVQGAIVRQRRNVMSGDWDLKTAVAENPELFFG